MAKRARMTPHPPPVQANRDSVAAGVLGVDSVQAEARRPDVELVTMPTKRAIDVLATGAKDTNAILHVTC